MFTFKIGTMVTSEETDEHQSPSTEPSTSPAETQPSAAESLPSDPSTVAKDGMLTIY